MCILMWCYRPIRSASSLSCLHSFCMANRWSCTSGTEATIYVYILQNEAMVRRMLLSGWMYLPIRNHLFDRPYSLKATTSNQVPLHYVECLQCCCCCFFLLSLFLLLSRPFSFTIQCVCVYVCACECLACTFFARASISSCSLNPQTCFVTILTTHSLIASLSLFRSFLRAVISLSLHCVLLIDEDTALQAKIKHTNVIHRWNKSTFL